MPPNRRRFLELLGTGTAGMLAGCSDVGGLLGGGGEASSVSAGSWPMVGRTPGNDAYHGQADGPGTDLSRQWDYAREVPSNADASSLSYSSPVVSHGTVYSLVSGQHHGEDGDGDANSLRYVNELVALDAETGDRQWVYDFDYPDGYSPHTFTPAVVGDTVVAGLRTLHGVDAATGDRRWRTDREVHPSGPIVAAGGEAFLRTVGPDQPALVAIDVADGSEQWSVRVGLQALAAPAVSETAVYATDGVDVVAFDRDDGSERWRVTPGPRSLVVDPGGTAPCFTPVVDGDTVYVAGSATAAFNGGCGALVALDRDDGSERWRFQPDGDRETAAGVFGVPVLADGTLYVTGGTRPVGRQEPFDSALYAVDADDGSLQWTAETERVGLHHVGADGLLYVLTGPALAVHRLDGGALASSTTLPDGVGFVGQPNAVVGERFLTASERGLLAFGPA